MRVGRVVVAEPSEEQIVGTLLAKRERIVAGLGAAGADHHLVLHPVDDVGKLFLAAFDMNAIGADAAGDPRIAGNDRRHAAFLGDRDDAFGERLEGGVVHVVGGKQDRRDVAARKRILQPAVEIAERVAGRGDQHDAAAVRRSCCVHCRLFWTRFAMESDLGWIAA